MTSFDRFLVGGRRRVQSSGGGKLNPSQKKPIVFHSEFISRMNWIIALSTQNRSILLTKQEPSPLLNKTRFKNQNQTKQETEQNPIHPKTTRIRSRQNTRHTSQTGASAAAERSREKRRCFEASLLAWWTRWSQRLQSAASSAVQNTDASPFSQTSHWIFISRLEETSPEQEKSGKNLERIGEENYRIL